MKFKIDEIKKEIFSLDVSGYSDFVDRKEEIIADIFASTPTLGDLVPQVGAKAGTTVELNILESETILQNGQCVTDFSGSTTLYPREAKIARITNRKNMCIDKLDAKLPMIMKPGARNEELPFAEQYINLEVANTANLLEKQVWQGDATGSTVNLNNFDGYLKISLGETADLAYYNTFSSFTGTTAIDVMDEALANRSEKMWDDNDVVAYVSQPFFYALTKAIRSVEGINPTGAYNDSGHEEQVSKNAIYYPGTSVVVKATQGLNGNNSVFITTQGNLRYLTDLESDKENVDLFFDKYHKELVSDLVFGMAVQYEFADRVILLEYNG